MQGGLVEYPLWDVCVSQSLAGNYIFLELWVPGQVFKASPRTSPLGGFLADMVGPVGWIWSEQEKCRDGGFREENRDRDFVQVVCCLWESFGSLQTQGSHTGEGEFSAALWGFFVQSFSPDGLMTKCQKFGIAAHLCLKLLTSLCWETSHSCVKLTLLRILYLCSTNVRSWKGMFLTVLQGYFDQCNLFLKNMWSRMLLLSLCFAFPLLLCFGCRKAHDFSQEKEVASSCTRGCLGWVLGRFFSWKGL